MAKKKKGSAVDGAYQVAMTQGMWDRLTRLADAETKRAGYQVKRGALGRGILDRGLTELEKR